MHRILVMQWGRTAAGPTLTLTVARALIEQDQHAVHVSYSRSANVASEFDVLPVPHHRVSSWRSARDVPRTLASLPAIALGFARFVRRHRIDTVVIPMEHPLHASVVWMLRPLGVRQVLLLHDGELHPGETGRLRSLMRTLQFRSVDSALVFSEHVRHGARELLRLDDDQIAVTNLPPMLSHGSVEPRELTGGTLTLGMFGRAVEYKGFDLAVDAVRLLRKDRSELQLRLVGAGVGAFVDAGGETWLRVEDRYLDDDEIPALMRELDVLLLPYREASQSGVLVEAMAAGLPVVVTPVGGLPGQVQRAECGAVADAVTSEAVAAAIDAVIQAPARYREYSRNGLRAASGAQGRASFLRALSGSVEMAHGRKTRRSRIRSLVTAGRSRRRR